MHLLVVAVAACAGDASAFLSHRRTAPGRRTTTCAAASPGGGSSGEDDEVRRFRERLVRGEKLESSASPDLDFDALARFAAASNPDAVAPPEPDPEWAEALPRAVRPVPGTVLLGNPDFFCDGDWRRAGAGGGRGRRPPASLLSKFGLTLPPPADLGPDRQADLLPVLFVVGHDSGVLGGSSAVMMNRRTGYLLGDLEGDSGSSLPGLGPFMIQPLWFGGTSGGSGMAVLHQCGEVEGCDQLTEDGIFFGGDIGTAGEALNKGKLSGFQFKFFVQQTRWLPLQLEKEIRDGTWIAANVSRNVLFRPRDRNGVRPDKPLWTEIMELLGGEHVAVKRELYGEAEPEKEEDGGGLGGEEDMGDFQ